MERDNIPNSPRGCEPAKNKENNNNSEVWSAADHRGKSFVPVISDISPRGDHPQHHLALPRPVANLQLNEHTAARSWRKICCRKHTNTTRKSHAKLHTKDYFVLVDSNLRTIQPITHKQHRGCVTFLYIFSEMFHDSSQKTGHQ